MDYQLAFTSKFEDLPLSELMALMNWVEQENQTFLDTRKGCKTPNKKAHHEEMISVLCMLEELIQTEIDQKVASYLTITMPDGTNAFEHYPAEEGEVFPFA